MPLREFKATNFRCLTDIGLEASPGYNLIYGPNAAGKTSILEAIAYLGRGKSFRGTPPQYLIQHGRQEFRLLGRVDTGTRLATVGLRNGRGGLEVKIDGDRATSAAALAGLMPLQVIDPAVHRLVGGPPAYRRQYLDWLAFHVEHGYGEQWRRFMRALRQRNAALREGANARSIRAWDREFLQAADAVDETRRRVLGLARPVLRETAGTVVGCPVDFEYRPGWPAERGLAESLAVDTQQQSAGATQAGPQRAELRLVYERRQARRLVSRGQQKLLASAMILAATAIVQEALGRPLLLLLDDPAAELDEPSLERLMSAVFALGSQTIATALKADSLRFPESPSVFHVEQGELEKAG